MLSAEELEAQFYQRFQEAKVENERRKANPDRDAVLENVWVAYVWMPNDDGTGEWILGGFRRKRNLRRVQTMGRFFAKIRRKLGIDKKSQVMLLDLGTAKRRTTGDQSWRYRPPQFQRRQKRMPQITPQIDRTKRKRRAKQKAYIFNPKTTKYIALARSTTAHKRKRGYLYLGPLKSEGKRQAQFEIKRLFPLYNERLVIATTELSKPLRAALARNRKVRAGVTRMPWPEVPPTFDVMWNKFVRRLVSDEFIGLEVDDPAFLEAREELHGLWQKQKQPWLTMGWFRKQVAKWSGACEMINVADLLPKKAKQNDKRGTMKHTKQSRVKRAKAVFHGTNSRRNRSVNSKRPKLSARQKKRVISVTAPRVRKIKCAATKYEIIRATARRVS